MTKATFDKKFLINLILQIIFLTKKRLTKSILKNLILERKIGTRQICDLKKNIWKKKLFIWQSKLLAFYDWEDFFGRISVLTNIFGRNDFCVWQRKVGQRWFWRFFLDIFFLKILFLTPSIFDNGRAVYIFLFLGPKQGGEIPHPLPHPVPTLKL